MKNKMLLGKYFLLLFICAGNLGLDYPQTTAPKKCFFKSDCPARTKCVTLKGESQGYCEEDLTPVAAPDEKKDTNAIACRFHSECGKGNICVKSNGSMTGTCQPDPLNQEFLGDESAVPTITDLTRCTFNTDCKTGSKCVKSFGQLTGTCEEPSILKEKEEEEKKEEKSIFDKPRKRKQCLQDTDCGINGICVTLRSSVFGECRDKSDPTLLAP